MMKFSGVKNNFPKERRNLSCINDCNVNLNEVQAVLYEDVTGLLPCISIILWYCFHYPTHHSYCL